MRDLDRLERLAGRNHGLISLDALRAAAFDDSDRRRLLRRGVLVPAGSRAYRVIGASPTPHQRLLQGCLDVGGWASHRSALGLHGLSGFPLDDPVEIVVRKSRHSTVRSDPRTALHVSRGLPERDLTVVDGIPTVALARALIDLASLVGVTASVEPETVVRAVEEAVRLRKTPERWLWVTLERTRRRGRRGIVLFEEVLARRSDGEQTESWLERETLRLLREAGLPLPECQARISARGAFVARVDFLYPDLRVVLEVSGYTHHRTVAQTTADAHRRRDLTLAGYQVHEFTYEEIVHHPERLLDLVRGLFER